MKDSLGQAIVTIEFGDITEFGAIFNVVYNQVDGYYYVTHGSIVGQFGYLSRFSLNVQYDKTFCIFVEKRWDILRKVIILENSQLAQISALCGANFDFMQNKQQQYKRAPSKNLK